ncbi:LytS/YhcK type 5TM receptor domain-containing protein [Paenibacillus sp. JTLBN-2024]
MFETLLLNFLFLLVPVIVFLVFFENRPSDYHGKILVLLSAASMILCISMPIQLSIGFIVDLRYIPFLVVALYGGYRSVFLLYIILNLYRFYVGGEGTMQSFLFSTTIMVIVPYYSAKFMKLSSRGRILLGDDRLFFDDRFLPVYFKFCHGGIKQSLWGARP